MNARNVQEFAEAKSGRLDQACLRYNLGRGSMRQLAEDAEAIIRIGKCLLINYTKVDQYLDAISGDK